MATSRFAPKVAAIAILLGLIALTSSAATSWIDSYADGQREIAAKQAQARHLHEIARARTEFAHLTAKPGKSIWVFAPGDDEQAGVSSAISQAAAGQQVVVDNIETLPGSDPALLTVGVRLRGTQDGIYSFLRNIEEQEPYLIVPRFELSLIRAADIDHHKPIILSSELHIAAVRVPAPALKATTQPTLDEPAP